MRLLMKVLLPQRPSSPGPPPTARTQAVCDNCDAWALWLSPPAFILFNIAYWLAYMGGEDGEDAGGEWDAAAGVLENGHWQYGR